MQYTLKNNSWFGCIKQASSFTLCSHYMTTDIDQNVVTLSSDIIISNKLVWRIIIARQMHWHVFYMKIFFALCDRAGKKIQNGNGTVVMPLKVKV